MFMAYSLMKNRNGMLTDLQVSTATGTAEREAVPVPLGEARPLGKKRSSYDLPDLPPLPLDQRRAMEALIGGDQV